MVAAVIGLTAASFAPAAHAAPVANVRRAPAAAPPGVAPGNDGALRPSADANDDAGTLPERIDVQTMKRRYWTVGNEDLMDVVQNRLYTKKGRIELGVRYGFWSDDPFQDMKTTGVSLGYHFNEFWSLHAFYAKVSASNNQAYAQAAKLLIPTINPSTSVSGLEARASLIYGKLSLLGSKIIYYDLNVAGGLSQHKAVVGSSTGFFVGLGQQFFLNKTFFLTLDYRLLFHTDKFNSPPAVDRSLTTNWIQLGVGVFAF